MRRKKLPKPCGAMRLLWSPINQAYFLMWHDQVVCIISDRSEAIAEFNRCTEGYRKETPCEHVKP